MSDDTFSLLERSWIPVLRASGARENIRPAEITACFDSDPIATIAWGRPDLDAATREFLIGLLATACGMQAREDTWRTWFNDPPRSEELDAAFAPLAPAFLLDGPGPRFQQDLEELANAKRWSVRELLIDARETHFNKESLDFCLSRAAASIALHALQSYAPEGGRGHFVSLRGGGPLTTILVPGRDDTAPGTLWELLWLNVPTATGDSETPDSPIDLRGVFPWLVPTRSNANGTITTAVNVDNLQAFWGMPRRIRLNFERNDRNLPCGMTGELDAIVVKTFVTEGKGTKYDGIEHPLSAYRRDTPNAPWRAMRTPEGRVGYRHWSALVATSQQPTSLSRPASGVLSSRNRLSRKTSQEVRFGARLLASGYRTQQNKARNFIESEMPLHLVREDLFGEYSLTVEAMVAGARDAAFILRMNVRQALFGDNAPSDGGKIADARERFWDQTEPMFADILAPLARDLESSDEATGRGIRQDARETWLKNLQRTTEALFDELVPQTDFDLFDIKTLERRVEARRSLRGAMRGCGKFGQQLFKSLDLPPPEPTKSGRKRDLESPATPKPRREKAPVS